MHCKDLVRRISLGMSARDDSRQPGRQAVPKLVPRGSELFQFVGDLCSVTFLLQDVHAQRRITRKFNIFFVEYHCNPTLLEKRDIRYDARTRPRSQDEVRPRFFCHPGLGLRPVSGPRRQRVHQHRTQLQVRTDYTAYPTRLGSFARLLVWSFAPSLYPTLCPAPLGKTNTYDLRQKNVP